MRFFNSMRNSVAAFLGQIITILFGMVIRWIFVHMLGQEYLGVNSVMESMLMLLSMTELGISTSVAFALYKPIDEGDERRIGSLMAFYRKVYHAMGILTAVIGPMLIPFMGFFTKEAVNVSNLNLINSKREPFQLAFIIYITIIPCCTRSIVSESTSRLAIANAKSIDTPAPAAVIRFPFSTTLPPTTLYPVISASTEA